MGDWATRGAEGDDDFTVEAMMCLCLCGRDPRDPEVQREFQKVIALALRYGLQADGCLRDAARAYDDLLRDLNPAAAGKLERDRKEVRQQMDADQLDSLLTTHPDAVSGYLN